MRNNLGQFSKGNKERLKGFNNYIIKNKILYLTLNNNKICLIDSEDLYVIKQYTRFYYDSRGYVKAVNGPSIHRLLTNCPLNNIIDHINHNPLDNRKSNLRIATKITNGQNSIKKDKACSSKFKGVNFRPDRNKWRSYITG
jgi:hypothetical protein